MRIRKSQVGVSLLELMVVLTIAGIAMSAAVPSFQGMIARNRVTTKVNELLLAINLARSEAIRIGGGAYVVSANDPDLSTYSASNEFGEGWCVVVPLPDASDPPDRCAETSGVYTVDDYEVIRVFEPLIPGDTFDSIDNVNWIEFDGLGAMSETAALPRRFDLCSTRLPDGGRRVHINLIGRSKAHGVDDPDENRQPDC